MRTSGKFDGDGKFAILFLGSPSVKVGGVQTSIPTSMASHKLPNYLRLYRKRLGLSQYEVAFLLGWDDGSQPSRYEHFSRMPELRTALAFAVIFRVPVQELFSGEYQKVERAVCRQAQLLKNRLAAVKPAQRTARKLAMLKMMVPADPNHS